MRTARFPGPRVRWKDRPLSDDDTAVALGQLAVLLDGGVVLSEAIESLRDFEARPRRRRAWADLATCIDQGQSLSAAIAALGLTRHRDVVAVLSAAESDASLADACSALEASMLVRVQHAKRLRTALLYPVVAGVCLLLASVFLLWRVVPAMSVVASQQQALSWHALPLVWVSDVLQAMSPVQGLGAGFAGACLILLVCAGTDRSSSRLKRWMPLVSHCDQLFQLATYADILRRLRLHGTPLLDSMRDAESCIDSPGLLRQLVCAREQVALGRRLAASLADAPQVPPLVCRLLSVGETTGSLDGSLQRVAGLLDSEARIRLERMQALAPVLVLVLVGALLLWIIVSIILPVYELALAQVVAP